MVRKKTLRITTQPTGEIKRDKKSLMKKIFPFLLISLATLIVYFNSFSGSFHFDDFSNIVYNNTLTNWDYFKEFNLRKSRFFGYLSFALNRAAAGEAYGFHVTNFVIHTLTSILVWYFILILFDTPRLRDRIDIKTKRYVALAAALIFAVHPLQTQAVTYIVQRLSSLAALFYVLGIVVFIVARTTRQLFIKVLGFVGALGCGFMALYTKESAASFPLALLLVELIGFRHSKRTLAVIGGIPLLLGAIITYLAVTMYPASFVFGSKLTNMGEFIDWKSYLFTQFRVIFTYLRLTFFPIGQNLDYYFPVATGLDLVTLASYLGVLSLIVFTGLLLWKAPFLGFSMAWFFITLSIESTFLPIEDVIYEHRMYLPMVGLSLLFAYGLHYLSQKLGGAYVVWVGVAVVVFGFLTIQRNEVWKNEISLWNDVVMKSPNKARGHNTLAVYYEQAGDYQAALKHYQRAIEIKPEHAIAHANLSSVLRKLGRLSEAERAAKLSISYNPTDPVNFNQLGMIYMDAGRSDLAEEAFREAIRLRSNYANAINNLGIVLIQRKAFQEGCARIREVLTIEPQHSGANQIRNACVREGLF